MKTLAIIGAGDLGQQIAHFALSDKHYDSVVFFDDYTTQDQIKNIPVLGTINNVVSAYNNNEFDELIIGIGYKHLEVRKTIYDTFKDQVPFGKIIHSSCYVDQTAKIGQGCVIYPKVNLDANTEVKENCILNINCTIAHDSVIGSHSFLSPRVAIAGFVNVEEQCILGINATIIDNITITSKTQLGAGTVVIKSIEKQGLYVGNPAKFIR